MKYDIFFNLRKVILTCVLVMMCSTIQAETAYVTDKFKITVRSGESAEHRVISLLETGAKVNVLSVNARKGYSRVRLQNGKQGYVLTRHLKKERIARDQLADLQQEIKALKNSPDALKLAQLSKQHTELQAAHAELTDLKHDVEAELTTLKRTAADAIRISNERNQLRKQVTDLTRSNEELKQENLEMDNNQQQRWFLIGAGVVILGIVIGLILPRLSMGRQKDSLWGGSSL